MGLRRRAREHALMILYAVDLQRREPDAAVEAFYGSFGGAPLDPPPPYALDDAGEGALDEAAREYASVLVEGVMDRRAALDAAIQGVSRNWRLERMTLIDRNVLRLGAFELTALAAEVPRAVVIDEAVELAKRFGTAESGAFVNGILDRIGR